MVKIRLRRIGTKGAPFYRVVVAKSTAGRNGSFVETIGTYDPVNKTSKINIKEDRALYWLMQGAQPTETTAWVLNKVGVLEKYFEARPTARKAYSFLDKRTAATSVASVIDTPAVEAPAEKAAPAPEPEPEPVVEAVAAVEEPAVEVPVEEPAAEAPAVEEPATEEAPVEEPAEKPAEA